MAEQNMDINVWLNTNRLSKFKSYFEENEVIIDDLLSYTEQDMDDIVQEMKQNGNVSLGTVYIKRFKDNVRALQHKHSKSNISQTGLNQVYRIVMTPKQNQLIKTLEDKLATIDISLGNNMNITSKTLENGKQIENDIVSVFIGYQKQLEERQKLLITKLNQQINGQLDILKKKKDNLEKYKESVQTASREQNAMVLDPNLDSSKRETKMEKLTNDTMNGIDDNDLNVVVAPVSFIANNNAVNKYISEIGAIISEPDPPTLSVSDVGVNGVKVVIECKTEDDVVSYGLKYKDNVNMDDEKKTDWKEIESDNNQIILDKLKENVKYDVCGRYKISKGNVWSRYSEILSFKTMKQKLEKWDVDNSGKYAVFDGKFVSNKKTEAWFSAFGRIGVNDGKHEWQMKIDKIGNRDKHYLVFGIVTSSIKKNSCFNNKNNDETTNYYNYAFGNWLSSDGYVFEPKHGHNDIRNFKWNDGDHIVMLLDLTNQILRYTVNGKEIVTINNIYNDLIEKENVKYRIGVANYEYEGETKIELISYTQM